MAVSSHKDYNAAFNAAVDLANKLGRETGIESTKEFGKPVFLVHTLPKPENRYGFELRVQVVRPNEPKIQAKENEIPH